VALRIGFDLDGVLADMEAALVREAKHLFGESIAAAGDQPAADAPEDVADASAEEATSPDAAQPPASAPVPTLGKLNLTPKQQRKLWRHVETVENFWETLTALEDGVVQRLSSSAIDRRWEIIFLTKRPATAGATAQRQTQRWLEAQGFTLPSVYVVQGSRGRIAAALALDVVIDDRPENCLDVVVDSKARAILVWRQEEDQLPAAAKRLGVGVVSSVADCLDILEQIDDASREQPGMMERVLRLLGLREVASA
jgi:hypothetical protein